VILLDAHPIVAYLADERPASDVVEPLLVNGAATTVNMAEVLDTLIRMKGVDPDDALADVHQLGLLPIVVRSRLAEDAALLRAKHYHRSECSVSLADCVAAAATLTLPSVEALAAADPALLGLVHAEGGNVMPLPDSTGRVWSPPS
jgi:PIN domain nuclease of toxin-antitoxin system